MRGPTSERKKLCNRPRRNGDDATEEEEEEEPVLIRCASYFPHSSFFLRPQPRFFHRSDKSPPVTNGEEEGEAFKIGEGKRGEDIKQQSGNNHFSLTQLR